jgi:hypothetical protein
VRGKTLTEFLSVILRDLITAHLSLRCATRAATGGNRTTGQDHQTLVPGNPVPPDSTAHRPQSGTPGHRAAGSRECGSDDRQGPATAACPPRQGRCLYAAIAGSVKSVSHLKVAQERQTI